MLEPNGRTLFANRVDYKQVYSNWPPLESVARILHGRRANFHFDIVGRDGSCSPARIQLVDIACSMTIRAPID